MRAGADWIAGDSIRPGSAPVSFRLAIGPGAAIATVVFRPSGLATHTRGLLITGAGVLLLTPDTLLLRLADLDLWTSTFWRELGLGLTLTLGIAVVYRRATIRVFLAMGWAGLSVALLFGANGILFVVAITNTGVANALVIYATAPVIAALLSWVFLRERVSLELWLVIFLTCGGIAIVMWDGVGRGTLLGDIAAVFVAITMAGMFVVLRAARAVNLIPATALGSLAAGLVVLAVASPLDVTWGSAGYVAAMGIFVLPISFALITLGPRYLPAPEVGLLMLLETVLGPLWVWIVLSEEPPLLTIVGGAVVLATLAGHSVYQLRRSRPAAPSP